MERTLIYTNEFTEFVGSLSERALQKLKYSEEILITEMPLSQKFVKKLVSSIFYELRISVENEIRVIIFAADNENINLAKEIYLLHGFIKKSNKDYEKNIRKAMSILNNLIK